MTAVQNVASAQGAAEVGGAQGHHHHGHMRQVLSSAADKLGMSQDDLMQDLKSGKSLADIAQSKGVSRDDLVAAVAQGLEQNAPAGATSADATKFEIGRAHV